MNPKTSQQIMKNNLAPALSDLQKTNIIYQFTCPLLHSNAEQYIGLTTTTLSRRLTSHLQSGSIRQHFEEYHNIIPTRQQLVDNTIILHHVQDKQKLAITEAITILQNSPSINKQYDNFSNILKLNYHRSNNITQSNQISSHNESFNPIPDSNITESTLSCPHQTQSVSFHMTLRSHQPNDQS